MQFIKMLICVTMYNEDEELLTATLNGVAENIHSFDKYGIAND